MPTRDLRLGEATATSLADRRRSQGKRGMCPFVCASDRLMEFFFWAVMDVRVHAALLDQPTKSWTRGIEGNRGWATGPTSFRWTCSQFRFSLYIQNSIHSIYS